MSSNAVDWGRIAPELAERESLYRTIFQATSDGIAIWNLEGEVVEVNPAICRMHGYSEAEFLALPVAAHVHPDYHETRRRFMQRVRAGESFRIRALDVRKDGSVFPVDVLGIPVTFRGGPHVVSVMRDISDQVEAEDTLGQRVEERTRELSALLAISRAAASNFDLRTIVRTVLGHLGELVEHDAASVSTLDGDFLVEYFDEGVRDTETAWRHDVRKTPMRWQRIARLETIIIPDTNDPDDELAREFQTGTGRRGLQGVPPYCWMAVPLVLEDRVTGLLVLRHRQPGFYTEQHAVLVRAVADQIALAIENARLFADTQRRAGELAALLAISRATTASLDLPTAVDAILSHLGGLVEHSIAVIDTFDGEYLYEYQRGAPADTPPRRHAVAANPRRWARLANLETVIIPDTSSEDDEMAEEIRANFRMRGEGGEMPATSWMAVPLAIEQRVVGLLVLNHETPGFYTREHGDLVGHGANQIALAIENARLFADAQRRASELAALLAISRVTAASLDLPAAVDAILGHLGGLVEHSVAAIDIFDGEYLTEYRRGVPDEPSTRRYAVRDSPLTWKRLSNGETLIVASTGGNDELAQEFRERERLRGDYWSSSPICLMWVPLAIEQRVVGLLSLSHETPGFYTEQHAALARAASDQIAVAIENARLFAESERRASELAALLAIAQAAAASLDLRSVVATVLGRLRDLVEHDTAFILTLEGDDLVEHWGGGSEQPEPPRSYAIRDNPQRWARIAALETVIIADTSSDNELAVEQRESSIRAGATERAEAPMCWMGVPLAIERRIVGLLVLYHERPGYYTAQHAALARAVADQVALAVENARLFEQAQHAASLEERQRLARELHDSVSQALYGIALGARTALRRAERSPQDVAEPLEYVLSLSEAALTEMRALIFELRPEWLETEGLVAALSRQAETMRARHGIAVVAALGEEPPLAMPAREALYRIAQEALHNVVKHAQAANVQLSLACRDGNVTLTVTDDGAGFDPEGDFSGHLGLRSMRERAAKSGGTLTITAEPGKGTALRVSVPAG